MGKSGFLYEAIATTVREEILSGALQAGELLPTVRQMTDRWGCTPGTVQRAYRELARQGLVEGRRGRGTRVLGAGPKRDESPLRQAELVHRAESFLLEVLAAGHAAETVEPALVIALDRWRSATRVPAPGPRRTIRFVGSHDLGLDWLAGHFAEIIPNHRLEVRFTGSLGGLIALAKGEAEIAGCHLWDVETDTYNAAFVRRVLPGQRVALITVAERRVGLIVPVGNPRRVQGLLDLARPEIRFMNRQPGSGTRVWLDAHLHLLEIAPARIRGYDREEATHSAVARSIAEGKADAGLGLEAAAASFGLDFVYLTSELYQLAVPAQWMERSPLQALARWLKGAKAKATFQGFRGYDASASGTVIWVT